MNPLAKEVIRLAFWNTMAPISAPLNTIGFILDVKDMKTKK